MKIKKFSFLQKALQRAMKKYNLIPFSCQATENFEVHKYVSMGSRSDILYFGEIKGHKMDGRGV
jgi:hypothetical protein